MVDRCMWCKYNSACPHKMGIENAVCDLESLPMEKEVVIERIRSEMRFASVELAKMHGKSDEELHEVLAAVSDKMAGIKIMMDGLEGELGVKKADIAKSLGTEGMDVDLNFAERMKLALRIKRMQDARRSNGKKQSSP